MVKSLVNKLVVGTSISLTTAGFLMCMNGGIDAIDRAISNEINPRDSSTYLPAQYENVSYMAYGATGLCAGLGLTAIALSLQRRNKDS